MDAVARERGLEHIETCAQCAALLFEERALSMKLRSLSVEAAAEEIPAHIETGLLAAFRQQIAAPSVEPLSSAPPGRRRWLLAAAALILFTLGLSLAGWVASSPGRESIVTDSTTDKVTPAPTGAPKPDKPDEVKPQAVADQRPARPTPDSTAEKRQERLPLTNAGRRSAGDGEPREFVTQFFPVIQGSELIPLESGQIVRVRMPRSNLIPLGIPFSQERADETIQADVLVSNDGLARAIRLVY